MKREKNHRMAACGYSSPPWTEYFAAYASACEVQALPRIDSSDLGGGLSAALVRWRGAENNGVSLILRSGFSWFLRLPPLDDLRIVALRMESF